MSTEQAHGIPAHWIIRHMEHLPRIVGICRSRGNRGGLHRHCVICSQAQLASRCQSHRTWYVQHRSSVINTVFLRALPEHTHTHTHTHTHMNKHQTPMAKLHLHRTSDWYGRSTAAGSLMLWTHKRKAITWKDSFVPSGAPHGTPPVPAVTVESGVQFMDLCVAHFPLRQFSTCLIAAWHTHTHTHTHAISLSLSLSLIH